MSTWIYVTNLPLYYDELNVQEIFTGIGQIATTKLDKDALILNSTAMIEFSHSKHAKLAAAKKDQTIIDKLAIRVYVIWCHLENLSTIRCYNIDSNCTNMELEKYFTPFGAIVNIQIIDNKIQSKPCSPAHYALVSFSRVANTVHAVQELNGNTINLGAAAALSVELVNVDARNLKWKRISFEYISLNKNFIASSSNNCNPSKMEKLLSATKSPLLSPIHNTSNGKYRTYSIISHNSRCKSSNKYHTDHERMCYMMEMVIYGYIRYDIQRAIMSTHRTEMFDKQESILSEIMNITFYYCCFEAHLFEKESKHQPLYIRDPNVPAPPQRTPPLPPNEACAMTVIAPKTASAAAGTQPKAVKMIKKIVVQRSDLVVQTEKKESEKSLTGDAPIFIPSSLAAKTVDMMNNTNIEGKYQKIFDIYRDRLDAIEGKMSVLKDEVDAMSLTMNHTLLALEQRRINDINTIQKQFNATITALCYQINDQINNQIKIMSSKMESSRKENVNRIEELEQQLCHLKKENDVLRKQQKINKILKLKYDGTNLEELEEKHGDSEIDKLKFWLTEKAKLPQYLDLLLNNGYDDLESMQDITFSELEQIGINKMGHRKKLVKYAAKLVFINTKQHRSHHHHKSSASMMCKTNGSAASNTSGSSAMSPNSATTHSSLYSHNIWSDDSVSSIPWNYTQNQSNGGH